MTYLHRFSELGAVAERIRRGETIEVLDDGRVVAMIVPVHPLERRMREPEAKGLSDQIIRERPED